jgi:hypothetical protein
VRQTAKGKVTHIAGASMLKRVPQRRSDDCTIAVVATVMGPPYTYEKVLADSLRYPQFASDGRFFAWWETYLRDSGFPSEYRPLWQLPAVLANGDVAGILMLAPKVRGQPGHVVAVDKHGFINPSTNWPDRIGSLKELISECRRLGYDYEPEKDFLGVHLGRGGSPYVSSTKGLARFDLDTNVRKG